MDLRRRAYSLKLGLLSNKGGVHDLPTVVLLLANILCVFLARRMAQDRAKPPTVWMWLAAFFGPVPLIILAVMPEKRG